ncbi:MAG: hypothetical protein H5U00_12060 [Clostridia bacterium]|nr:hypothetical protein [Clostridia bacterium]
MTGPASPEPLRRLGERTFAGGIIKLSGGIRERDLVLTLMGIEAVFGLLAVLLYARL